MSGMLPHRVHSSERDSPIGMSSSGSPKVEVLNVVVTSVVSPRMRHVIKRFLKRIGFEKPEVVHRAGDDPWTMRLVARARVRGLQSDDMMAKVEYLDACAREVLSRPKRKADGASDEDADLLRRMLAEVEPSMGIVFYTKS